MQKVGRGENDQGNRGLKEPGRVVRFIFVPLFSGVDTSDMKLKTESEKKDIPKPYAALPKSNIGRANCGLKDSAKQPTAPPHIEIPEQRQQENEGYKKIVTMMVNAQRAGTCCVTVFMKLLCILKGSAKY